MRKTTIYVVDMTCSSCVARITQILEAVDGVAAVRVSLKGGRADIEYDPTKTTVEAMKATIEKAGYTTGNGRNAGTASAVGIGLLLAALYMLANAAGLFNSLPVVNNSLGYGVLFIVGILTSVHCVAMCGGIALSQSVARFGDAEPSGQGKIGRLVPGLLYNGGRVVSYTIIGGIVGALGAAFSFTPAMKGLIAAVAGLFMVLLGLKMLGILSGLPRLSRILPLPVRNSLGRISAALGRRGPFVVGLLNGLMPCGPLQTMQLYALGTGSLLAGALSMFIFSVGTVPLMLVFSLAAAFIPRKFVPVMVKASAVLVLFLGLITFGRAAALSGIAFPATPFLNPGLQILARTGGNPSAGWEGNGTPGERVTATLNEGFQTVITDFGSTGYYMPFTVQAGVPVKWTIRVTADGLNGCNNPITIPSYGIKKTLQPGDNLIEFTPGNEGSITYTCWMGMISSRITVVGDLAAAKTPGTVGLVKPAGTPDPIKNPAAGAGLGSCCSGIPTLETP